MKRNQIIAVSIVAAGVIGWALFVRAALVTLKLTKACHPQLQPPTLQKPLCNGQLYGVATKHRKQHLQLADGKRILALHQL